jgi:hypothetical protein
MNKEKHPYIDAVCNYIDVPKKIYHSPFYFYNKYIKTKDGGGKIYQYKGYDFEVNESSNEDNVREIFIGNKKRCLLALLYLDPVTKKPDEEIILHSFGYFSNCAKDSNSMERIIGTDGVMKAFLKFVKTKYKGIVKRIRLTDESKFLCYDKLHNTTHYLSMNRLYVYKYGQFYYSKRYGFTLNKDKHDEHKIQQEINKYWKRRKEVQTAALYFIKQCYTFDLHKTYSEEILDIIYNMTKYNDISIFLQNYKFKHCILILECIKAFDQMFGLNTDIFSNYTFIYDI